MSRVLDSGINGTGVWERLATMVDTFGPRITGSQGLEKSIDWIEAQMLAEGGEVAQTG